MTMTNQFFIQAMEAQFRKTVNGLFVPDGADEPSVNTHTSEKYDPPPLDLEKLQEMRSTMATFMPPQIRIIESELCTVSEERICNRTWRERLFSRPWRPWQATATEHVQVPNPDLFVFEMPQPTIYGVVRTERVVIGHPATVRMLEEFIE